MVSHSSIDMLQRTAFVSALSLGAALLATTVLAGPRKLRPKQPRMNLPAAALPQVQLTPMMKLGMKANALTTELRKNGHAERKASIRVNRSSFGYTYCRLDITGAQVGAEDGTYTIGLTGPEEMRNFGQHGINFGCTSNPNCYSSFRNSETKKSRNVLPQAMYFLDIGNRSKVKSLYADMRTICPAAIGDFDNAMAAGSSTPEGQYKAVTGDIRARVNNGARWMLPSWGAQECKIRHLDVQGNVDAVIDLNAPIEISAGGSQDVVHFQCPGSGNCIDNPEGSDHNNTLLELKGATGATVVSKIADMRQRHPVCN